MNLTKPQKPTPLYDATLLKKYIDLLEHYTGNLIPEDRFQVTAARLEYFLIHHQKYDCLETLYQGIDASHKGSSLCEELLQSMMLRETFFFRDKIVFDFLENHVFNALHKKKPLDAPIKIWSAACSTGQEAYSLNILASRYKLHHAPGRHFSIDASDYNQLSVDIAKKGQYSDFEIRRGLQEDDRTRYFEHKQKNIWKVAPAIRKNIYFFQHNLLDLLPPKQVSEKYDVILCRNTLMYMSARNKDKIMHSLISYLAPDGFIVLGVSEYGGQLNTGLLIKEKTASGMYRVNMKIFRALQQEG